MIRRLIIRALFWLMGDKIEYGKIDDSEIYNWLADQYKDLRFRHYFKKRDLQLLKTLGTGLKEQSYWVTLGRRLELLRLLEQVNKIGLGDEKKRAKGRE